MTRNPGRRAALIDAAIEVLAREGARGLTFRAVDACAEVPTGTTSNYFASRDDVLAQAGRRVHERLMPDPDVLADLMRAPRDLALETALMYDLMDRVLADRTGYLALLELRLECTRRPRMRAEFTATIGAGIEGSVAFHVDHGFPGGRSTVITLYLAMLGLILEHLTLPDLFPEADLRHLIADLVAAIVPEP
jgi:AcrR family transcriptional regulator